MVALRWPVCGELTIKRQRAADTGLSEECKDDRRSRETGDVLGQHAAHHVLIDLYVNWNSPQTGRPALQSTVEHRTATDFFKLRLPGGEISRLCEEAVDLRCALT